MCQVSAPGQIKQSATNERHASKQRTNNWRTIVGRRRRSLVVATADTFDVRHVRRTTLSTFDTFDVPRRSVVVATRETLDVLRRSIVVAASDTSTCDTFDVLRVYV